MKKIKKIFLELYNDRKQILFLTFLGLLDYLSRDFMIIDIEVYRASFGYIAVAAIGAGATIYMANKNSEAAEKLSDDAAEAQRLKQIELDKQIEVYRSLDFKNPYEDMENVYEDLTVNQQQAEFQAQQGAQQRANLMQGLRGAAGASGIAGLAQAMANQGQLQTQQISALIGKQEAENQRIAARGAAQVQQLERQGEGLKQQFEFDREATILGAQYGEMAGANAAAQAAALNQQQTQAAGQMAIASTVGSLAGSLISADYSKPDDTTNARLADTNQFTGQTTTTGVDLPVNPSIGDFAEIGGVMKQWDGFEWVG